MCIRDSPPRNLLGTPSEHPGQPLSSSDSESARKIVQNAHIGRFGDQFQTRPWARAVQAPNASS
eukprot:688397-Alexandrium_andersonii.AAC.1